MLADKANKRKGRAAKWRTRKYHYPKMDIRLPQAMKDGLMAYCVERKVNRSDLVRHALAQVVPPIYFRRRGLVLDEKHEGLDRIVKKLLEDPR